MALEQPLNNNQLCNNTAMLAVLITAGVEVTEQIMLPVSRVLSCLQVCILDGNKYTSRCREAGEQRLEILDECEVCFQSGAS